MSRYECKGSTTTVAMDSQTLLAKCKRAGDAIKKDFGDNTAALESLAQGYQDDHEERAKKSWCGPTVFYFFQGRKSWFESTSKWTNISLTDYRFQANVLKGHRDDLLRRLYPIMTACRMGDTVNISADDAHMVAYWSQK